MTRPTEVTVYLVGGGQELGRAVAHEFVRAGTQRIGLIVSDTGAGERAAEQVRAAAFGVWSLSAVATPGVRAEMRRAVGELSAALGSADIVVRLPDGNTASADSELDGLITLGREVLPHMRADGGGTIVAVAAPGGSGSATLAFARTLAMATELDGIRMYALCAGKSEEKVARAVVAAVFDPDGRATPGSPTRISKY
jgi:NAD(P)-dependent dehydrogenase (short-subunit alcohol dehydrogenase family)